MEICEYFPRDVWEGKMTLKDSYTKYKNNVGIDQYKKFIEKWAKSKGYKTIHYYNKRATDLATERVQSSKNFKL